MKANSAVIWRGASLLDGAPIVVIASGLRTGSTNRKTGAMLQTYILRDDVSPVDAVKSGADASICGNCPHRGTPETTYAPFGVTRMAQRTCYVNVGQGALSVWRAYKRGTLTDVSSRDVHDTLSHLGRGRVVRLGTYGDPAAVPARVWQLLTADATGRTGYTHQWRNAPQLRSLCMASADSESDARDAQALGWRTFRVAFPGDLARLPVESICPASAEAGKKLTCAQCLACSGAGTRRGSIVIQAHGGFAVMANVAKRVST